MVLDGFGQSDFRIFKSTISQERLTATYSNYGMLVEVIVYWKLNKNFKKRTTGVNQRDFRVLR